MNKLQIAAVLKHSRHLSGMTQKEAAASLNRSQQTLAAWESGAAQPDIGTLISLFRLYGQSMDRAFHLVTGQAAADSALTRKIRSLPVRAQRLVEEIVDISAELLTEEAKPAEETFTLPFACMDGGVDQIEIPASKRDKLNRLLQEHENK